MSMVQKQIHPRKDNIFRGAFLYFNDFYYYKQAAFSHAYIIYANKTAINLFVAHSLDYLNDVLALGRFFYFIELTH